MKLETSNNQSTNTVKKLNLKKETIRVLQSTELARVLGGIEDPEGSCSSKIGTACRPPLPPPPTPTPTPKTKN